MIQGVSESAESGAGALSRGGPSWALFGISTLALFLELLLIRWVSTEIRIFAYMQNTVLVVCFLGLGMGCFTCRRPFRLGLSLAPLFVLLLLLTVPVTRVQLMTISGRLSMLGDALIWGSVPMPPTLTAKVSLAFGLAMTFALMVLLWAVFLPLGRALGRLMDDHPRPLWAYSVNVAGSLLGTWLFVAVSAIQQPPLVWFGLAGLGALPFLAVESRWHRLEFALLVGIAVTSVFAGRDPVASEVVWSPYQKLSLGPPDALAKRAVRVNNTGYQVLIDLADAQVRAHPETYPPRFFGYSQYDLPTRLHPDPARVLIVGAGAGNDVAGALRRGAGRVTAVEIDPAILAFGRRHHPERPYADARVELVVGDARSYFATTRERFDIIVFGLLDAHTTTAMTNTRLDHYVYTLESIARARDLLRPGGIVALTFQVNRPFIADRIARMLKEVFAQEPLLLGIPPSAYGWGGTMFVTGDLGTVRDQLAANPAVERAVRDYQRRLHFVPSYQTPVATDDWPYLYLARPSIPQLYYALAVLLGLLFLLGGALSRCARIQPWTWQRPQWHFFFLGAAFLLLEVQNISKACLALGSTWWVNAVIISGVLVMILLANGITSRWPSVPLPPIYACLLGSCAGLYFVDLAWFGGLESVLKTVVVGVVTTLPMIFAGIVFVRSFVGIDRKDEALGANLLGALVGAVLQTLTFVTGIKALLLLVAALYWLVFATRPRGETAGTASGAVAV
jgi:spermidine synthase